MPMNNLSHVLRQQFSLLLPENKTNVSNNKTIKTTDINENVAKVMEFLPNIFINQCVPNCGYV